MLETDILSLSAFTYDDFTDVTLDQELEIDGQYQHLLNQFYQTLLKQGMEPERASGLAFSADLYLRDYLLDFARQNVARPVPGIVTRFGATWFITHTLDPEMTVLNRHLDAIGELYRYLQGEHLISTEELAFLVEETAQRDFFVRRIESFLAITGDGYEAWEAVCPC